MSTGADQRDMTADEVGKMPPSPLRDILTASFALQQTARSYGFTKYLPALVQYLHVGSIGPGARAACSIFRDQDNSTSALTALNFLSEQLEDNPSLFDQVIHPEASQGAGFLGLAALYDGWVLPDSHPRDDPREPGDVPGAVPSVLLRGVTVDGAGFTVQRTFQGELRARVELLPDTAPDEPFQRALKRAAAVINACYAYAAPDGQSYPPPYQPLPSSYDFSAESPNAGAEDSPDETPDNEPGWFPFDQLDFIDDSLHDLIRDLVELEEDYHANVQWGAAPCIAIRHYRHGEDNHSCYTGMRFDDPSELSELADDIRNPAEDDFPPGYLDAPHEGFSVLYEGTFLPNGEVVPLSGPSDRAQVRVLLGITHAGVVFAMQRRSGRDPVFAVFDRADFSSDDASARFGEILQRLREINAAFVHVEANRSTPTPPHSATDDHSQPTQPEQPQADDLPVILPTALTLGFVACRTRWSPGQDRAGSVHSPLPSHHALAARLCVCGMPLGNGQPLQTYLLGPLDSMALGAFLAGQPHECLSVLAHQPCITNARATLIELASSMFGKWAQRYG